MPTARLTAAGTGSKPANKAFVQMGKYRLIFPITSPQVEHSDFTSDWVQISRPGLRPLFRRAHERLRRMTFRVVLASCDKAGVEAFVKRLSVYANNSGGPVTVSYGPLENGLWRLTEIEVSTIQRNPNNTVWHADVEMTFVEAYFDPPGGKPPSTQPPLAGEASGGATIGSGLRGTPTAPKEITGPRTYTVKAGDTLSGIALKMYGDANRYIDIARANNIRNVDLIHPGQVLIIP